MERKGFSEEQIIKIFQAYDNDVLPPELAREYGFAEGMSHAGKANYSGMSVWEAKGLKGLEVENKKLMKPRNDAGEIGVAGGAESNSVKPAARRRVVEFWVREGHLSQRHGCRLMGVSRSMVRYVPLPTNDADLRTRLKALAERYPRYGCPTLHAMLRHEGVVRNHKRTHRIYTEERLQVRTKRRKKLTRPRVPMLVPTKPNER